MEIHGKKKYVMFKCYNIVLKILSDNYHPNILNVISSV